MLHMLVQDPVTSAPAVLIKRYNISQQKELELQLADQQLALQRSAISHYNMLDLICMHMCSNRMVQVCIA